MGNALTGDFDVILQINQTVIQRLVAHLHANDGADSRIPTLPHDAAFMVSRDGKQGWLVAQVGVPRVRLIDGASDRFRLSVPVRAQFTPIPAEDPEPYLPRFIHGRIGAEYVLQPVDTAAPGWGGAQDHLQPVVDRSTVRFEGTANSGILGALVDPGDPIPRIQAMVADLLAGGMQATPHQLGDTFRPERMVTLSRDGGAAVAIGVVGDGDPRSIQTISHGGADLAVAISQEAILAPVRAGLAEVQRAFAARIITRFTALFDLWEVYRIEWSLRITEATATWLGGAGSGGDVEIGLTLTGTADNPVFSWAVHVTQRVRLVLDAAGRLSASVLVDPTIEVVYEGIERERVHRVVAEQARAHIRPQLVALAQQTTVDLGLRARAEELALQLRRLDPATVVALRSPRFTPDGVIIIGDVTTSPWKPWKVTWAVDAPGYSALSTWVPGGWIKSYTWSWQPSGASASGPRSHVDRFTVEPGIDFGGDLESQFGLGVFGTEQMPGIGGAAGVVRLDVKGVRIDDVTGEEVEFDASTEPIAFELEPYIFHNPVTTGVTVHGTSAGPGLVRLIVRGLGDMLGHGFGILDELPANSLVIRPGPGTTIADLAATLGSALTRVTREGAGLRLIVLAEPGLDLELHEDARRSLHEHVGRLVPFAVFEDVEGEWARSLGQADGADASWTALVSPHGGVPWAEPGVAGDAGLAAALDTFLAPSGPPRVVPVVQAIQPGTVLTPWALEQGPANGGPPPPIGRSGRRTVITFVRPDGDGAQDAVVDQVRPQLAQTPDDALVAVVVNGPDAGAVSRSNLGADDPVLSDPDGTIAQRLGVSIWPTTLLVDEEGTIVRVLTSDWSPREVTS